jgi:hypothetical protein
MAEFKAKSGVAEFLLVAVLHHFALATLLVNKTVQPGG